jgi:hypothetical protein
LVTTLGEHRGSAARAQACVDVHRDQRARRPAQRDQPGEHRFDGVLGARRRVRGLEREPTPVEDRVQPGQLGQHGQLEPLLLLVVRARARAGG